MDGRIGVGVPTPADQIAVAIVSATVLSSGRRRTVASGPLLGDRLQRCKCENNVVTASLSDIARQITLC